MIELPKAEKRISFATQIEVELLKEVKAEAKRRKLTLRQIVEFGFKKFLEESKK